MREGERDGKVRGCWHNKGMTGSLRVGRGSTWPQKLTITIGYWSLSSLYLCIWISISLSLAGYRATCSDNFWSNWGDLARPPPPMYQWITAYQQPALCHRYVICWWQRADCCRWPWQRSCISDMSGTKVRARTQGRYVPNRWPWNLGTKFKLGQAPPARQLIQTGRHQLH